MQYTCALFTANDSGQDKRFYVTLTRVRVWDTGVNQSVRLLVSKKLGLVDMDPKLGTGSGIRHITFIEVKFYLLFIYFTSVN